MCMTFGCNPQVNICHLFRSLNLVILCVDFYQSIIDTGNWVLDIGYLVNATLPTILPVSF